MSRLDKLYAIRYPKGFQKLTDDLSTVVYPSGKGMETEPLLAVHSHFTRTTIYISPNEVERLVAQLKEFQKHHPDNRHAAYE